MPQHLSHRDQQQYLERTIGPDGLLAADEHLANCEVCCAAIAELRSGRLLDVEMPGVPNTDDGMDGHLTYEQLTAFVDGKIDDVDREIVEVHASVCFECSDQVEELRHLRSTLELEPVSGLASQATGSPFSLFWSGVTAGAFVKFAAPVFAVLLIGVIAWSIWIVQQKPISEVVEVVQPPAIDNGVNANVATDNINSAIDIPANSTAAETVISLTDGGTKIGIDEKGGLTGLNAPQFESRVVAALTKETIEISQAAKALGGRSGTLMGGGEPGSPFSLTAPVGKIVESDRPQFNWRPLKDAGSYVVTVYDANFRKVAESPSLQKPGWVSPTRLKRGVIYQWQVTALTDGQEVRSPVRPAPDAKFKVLEAANANEIETVKREHGNSHLLLGIVYARAGLLDDAEREFQALVNQNPRSDIARRLLNKVRLAR